MPISFEQNVLRATMISNLGLGRVGCGDWGGAWNRLEVCWGWVTSNWAGLWRVLFFGGWAEGGSCN